MRRKTFTFFITLAIWILFAGKFSRDILIVGIIASLVTTWLYSDLLFRSSNRKRNWAFYLRKFLYILLFIPVFFYEAFVAALKVSKHVFEKEPSFSPGIVKVKTTLRNITALTILANLITLTPGTLTLDFDMRDKAFFIHWIDVTTVEQAETRREVIERFEKWLEVIFR
ncbi:MAG TPA: Na+/H+ antiporter subunit E [Halanaerobiales bacterium]|nr:Na+/H+ antiporter subunit E [Halanaerobiales bacterium]